MNRIRCEEANEPDIYRFVAVWWDTSRASGWRKLKIHRCDLIVPVKSQAENDGRDRNEGEQHFLHYAYRHRRVDGRSIASQHAVKHSWLTAAGRIKCAGH